MSIASSFGRSGFARFMNTPAGRLTRLVAGLALIGWGYTLRDSTSGIVLMVVGLIPFSAGLFDMCWISALLGGPAHGSKVGKDAQSPS